ncbi:nucleotide exchange factor GrpE [Ramlibacter sp. PS4R-6]|uniref:nucleotide exchange factor GrpE n=1 Tax=Ramlibacter sp. PS4R-6 TaxID=3133438 RepID=UPI0030B05910
MNEPDRIEPTLDAEAPAGAATAPAPAAESAAGGPQAANEADALSNAQAQVAELQAQNKDLAEKYLRAQADMQNTRRRADEEMSKARKFAVESFAEAMLPVVDSLEAGLAHEGGTPEQIREGAEITLRQLKGALERNKVVVIDPQPGTKFDPHQHQAISVVPGTSQEPNTVVGVLQKGYLIADRVLRPALVTVAAPK